jgi:hypothetical protein
MRVRNKELRQRRHRKEKTIKASVRDAKAAAGAPKPAAEAKPKAPAKKAAPKPKAPKKEATE